MLVRLLATTLTLTAGAISESAPPPASPHFELRDQYGGLVGYPLPDAVGNSVVLVAASDRNGAAANREWAAQLAARYAPHLEGRAEPRLVILPVAHLGGVPRPLRGLVRAFFRGRNPGGEKLISIGLDWRGEIERQLGLEPGTPNITVIDDRGVVVVQRAGRVEKVGDPVFYELDHLLRARARQVEVGR